MKKVLIITYYWPPSGGAGVQRWLKFVKYFATFNLEPIVLTVDPKSASYAIIDESLLKEVPEHIELVRTKSMEPFSLYKKFVGKKEIPYGGFANESNPDFLQKISRFIRGNLFIPDARVGWNRYAYAKAVALIEKYDIQTVITTSPPHSTQLIGQKLKRKLGLHWVADLRDPWTDIYYYDQLYHSAFSKRLDAKYERNTVLLADQLIVVSESIRSSYAAKTTEAVKHKIYVIPNGFDPEDFQGNKEASKDHFVITYTGTIAENYNMRAFFDALSRIGVGQADNKIVLQFVGKVSEGIKDLINHYELSDRVRFISHVKHLKSIEYLQTSSALLLAIPDVANNEGILTCKLFEYLAARKPIIGIGPVSGDAAHIIAECEAGFMLDYKDDEGIYNKLLDLYTAWKENPVAQLPSEKYQAFSRKALTGVLSKLV